MRENPQIRLNIVGTQDSSDFESPLFAHSTVGKNMYPRTTIDAFADVLENGLSEKTDAAFLTSVIHPGWKYVYSLVPDYTDDGSHLNEKGRKVVAEQFLLFLVNPLAGE